MARQLRRGSPKTGERGSVRKISAELKKAGYLNERGPAVQSEQYQNDARELMRQLCIGPVSFIIDRSGTTTARIDPDPSFFDAG
jgi:hypothetical protein